MQGTYFNPEAVFQLKVPNSQGISAGFQQGMQMQDQFAQQKQQAMLSQLLAQNTGADGQVDLNKAFQAVQSNPRQAYQPGMVNTLAGLIQQQNESRRKSSNDQLKFDADINKTYAETGKIQNEGTGKGLENSQKRYGALNQIFQSVAQTGNKSNALLGLMHANQAGLLSNEDFMQQRRVVEAMTPEQLMEYGSGISFGNAKDPASLLFTSADSRLNSETQQNIAGNRLAYDYANLGSQEQRFYDGLDNSNIQAQLNREQQYALQTGQGKLVTAADGKSYIQDFYGNITPATDANGQHITKNTKSTEDLRKESERLQKMESILTQAESLIGKSTSSGAGALLDAGAGFFGASPQGADNLAALKALQGALVMMMPRMEGPQSDKDVQLYREMAGRLGEAIPVSQRMEAIKVIRDLNAKYADIQGVSSSQQRPSTQYMPATKSDLEKAAKELGMTPQEVMKFLRP
ncbi:hypothetical protein EXE30_06885 [Acinetobacter halotolerans]|uniref:Uncharacterized protein n=1 Tax=Acinetobacter halotolerans TaxID=1752076 RepID=A0A4Q6XA62_9GAMM|nr:hypothetical protein [Acinetobacter halotolerans]RZF53695.1 hypothetical protein EXE30_06885 [Acinetobacter halotolerans]